MVKLFFFISIIFISSCSTPKKETYYKSVVYTEYGSAAYSKASNDSYIALLKSVEANMASVLMTCHTQNVKTNDISCTSANSPKKDKLLNLIHELKKNHFMISLRLYVDSEDGQWRALWEPEDKEEAFKNLKNTLVEYAEFAQNASVEVFVIGAELEKLTRPIYKNKWIEIISAIRKVYKGKLTYGANSNISSYETAEYQWVNFWDQLDFVGIDHYPPYEGVPTLENLVKHNKDFIKKYNSIAQGKKIYFNEIGFPSAKNGIKKPYEWKWDTTETLDYNQQAINFKSFLVSTKNENVIGAALWRFMPNESKIHPAGYLINNEATIKAVKESFLDL